MKQPRSVLVLAFPLLAAASDKPAVAPTDVAQGALSYLVSKRCESSPRLDTRTLGWPALVYARGRPPMWGIKNAGACRGIDTWVLSASLAAGAYWSLNDHKTIEADPMTTLFDDTKGAAAFKNAFGWALPARGDYVPPANVFLKFDPKKVSALFDRIYVKPTDKLGDVTAQEAYDVLLKTAVTRFAREVAMVKTSLTKAQLGKQLKAYQAAAKQAGGKFSGTAYLKDAAAAALPKDSELAPKAGRTLGVILRRTADGTWPIVDRLLKKVVTDYDPQLAKELATSL